MEGDPPLDEASPESRALEEAVVRRRPRSWLLMFRSVYSLTACTVALDLFLCGASTGRVARIDVPFDTTTTTILWYGHELSSPVRIESLNGVIRMNGSSIPVTSVSVLRKHEQFAAEHFGHIPYVRQLVASGLTYSEAVNRAHRLGMSNIAAIAATYKAHRDQGEGEAHAREVARRLADTSVVDPRSIVFHDQSISAAIRSWPAMEWKFDQHFIISPPPTDDENATRLAEALRNAVALQKKPAVIYLRGERLVAVGGEAAGRDRRLIRAARTRPLTSKELHSMDIDDRDRQDFLRASAAHRDRHH